MRRKKGLEFLLPWKSNRKRKEHYSVYFLYFLYYRCSSQLTSIQCDRRCARLELLPVLRWFYCFVSVFSLFFEEFPEAFLNHYQASVHSRLGLMDLREWAVIVSRFLAPSLWLTILFTCHLHFRGSMPRFNIVSFLLFCCWLVATSIFSSNSLRWAQISILYF